VNLFYVGRLFPEKSLDTLVNAVPAIVAGHSKTHVMIAGRGHMRPKLEKLTDTLGMRDHISFLELNDEDKILAFNVGDIFVSPSFAELEGMTVLEAMACGKPIIVPDGKMNAARHFVSDNGLLFKTADSNDLAVQVLRLIGDVDMRKAMGVASLEKSKKYDIHRSVEKQERVYYNALKK
jgi:1,2-diacylglycerol 3-alpha-glucosyltransferase